MRLEAERNHWEGGRLCTKGRRGCAEGLAFRPGGRPEGKSTVGRKGKEKYGAVRKGQLLQDFEHHLDRTS